MDARIEVLKTIESQVKNCTKCRLCQTALNAVPGEGNPFADIVFVGEAPGANEDATGRPFVGRAGKLLDELLKDIGLERKDVWIGNIIKHRPPENRDPLPDEVVACSPYLAAQLKAINPKLVVTLGRYAMEFFYKDGKITRDHGTAKKLGAITLYPVYHPAAALRNPTFMQTLRTDFKKIKDLINDSTINLDSDLNKKEVIKIVTEDKRQPSLF